MDKLILFPFDKVPYQSTIAIYGAGEIGVNFLTQVQKLKYCSVRWIVDRRYESMFVDDGVCFLSPSEMNWNEPDYIVVASIDFANDITSTMLNHGCSLNKIINISGEKNIIAADFYGLDYTETSLYKVAYKHAVSALLGKDKIHLACGPNILTGWANIDIFKYHEDIILWDINKGLPKQSDSVKLIYNEHFIEHVSLQQAKKILSECFRCLQVGGRLRISTPNLKEVIEPYINNRLMAIDEWKPTSLCQMLNEAMHLWGHQFIYDEQELTDLLLDVGFSRVNKVNWHESSIEDFKNIECRPYRGEIILEAVK